MRTTVVVCEDDTTTISCVEGLVLKIIDGFYGREKLSEDRYCAPLLFLQYRFLVAVPIGI